WASVSPATFFKSASAAAPSFSSSTKARSRTAMSSDRRPWISAAGSCGAAPRNRQTRTGSIFTLEYWTNSNYGQRARFDLEDGFPKRAQDQLRAELRRVVAVVVDRVHLDQVHR